MAADLPLARRTVGVTAARRGEELVDLLRRRGADVLHGPAISLVSLADDDRLRAATERLAEQGCDVLVVTTGTGLHGWLDAAAAWGLREPVLRVLSGIGIVTRGAKARGAVRALGLVEAWSAPSESVAEVRSHLLGTAVGGSSVVVQLHGRSQPELTVPLRDAGARVTELLPYRWESPEDLGPLDELLDAVAARRVDAMTFTSAAAVEGTLARAAARGILVEVLRALGPVTLPACVGPATAEPLLERGVPAVWPERHRTTALVRLVTDRIGPRCGTASG